MKPNQFPKAHLLLAGVLTLGLCSFVIAKFTDDNADDRFTTESVLLDLAALPANVDSTGGAILTPDPVTDAQAQPTQAVALQERHTQVKPGDNLANIFKREGIPAKELQKLLASKPYGPRLKRIFPGHDFVFSLTDDNTLMKLAYSPGPLELLEFKRVGESFVGYEVTREPERTTAYKHATIDHSLFVSSQRAGLDDALTMRLAQIFQWDIDFVLEIRRGDEFYLLFEELYLDDEFIGFGQILAAEFVNQGDSYRAVLYTDSRGDRDYYDPNGGSMRKAFLRAPVEFSRISSNFNLRRVHPLWKRSMPHRGIDYSAPNGTPILASGDGKVTRASRTKANGNYVVLRHGEQFVTKYLHLSKFGRGIRKGSKVKQGQTIGYVGRTGWATASHLHYEFLVNGVHQNPRTIDLPEAAPISKKELDRFSKLSQPRFTLLSNYKQQIQLAFLR